MISKHQNGNVSKQRLYINGNNGDIYTDIYMGLFNPVVSILATIYEKFGSMFAGSMSARYRRGD